MCRGAISPSACFRICEYRKLRAIIALVLARLGARRSRFDLAGMHQRVQSYPGGTHGPNYKKPKGVTVPCVATNELESVATSGVRLRRLLIGEPGTVRYDRRTSPGMARASMETGNDQRAGLICDLHHFPRWDILDDFDCRLKGCRIVGMKGRRSLRGIVEQRPCPTTIHALTVCRRGAMQRTATMESSPHQG